ncbi:MAG TPA: hypothetical protein PK833_00870, partial [Vicingus sp.]|nr:hypothetical protein [Vicingus sp.]
MKKIFTLLLIANLVTINSSIAQTLPIAVNDTFYLAYADTSKTHVFSRNVLTANDTLGSGTYKIIDTISYNGVNQVNSVYYTIGPIFWRVKEIRFTTNPGFFGKDSITYYFTDDGTPTGFDTAVIHFIVKRKALEYIDLNNIKAGIDYLRFFHEEQRNTSSFNVPKQQNVTDPIYATIYAANFWFAGLNSSSQLKGFAELFATDNSIPSNPYKNFTGNAGPLMDSIHYENYSYQWDRVWKVSTLDIQSHINGNGTTEAILNWPAHGDVSKGQAQNLAPFVDSNGDNYYNPLDGDYPLIKGQQAIYFIRNSDRTLLSGFEKSELEFHGMVYAYDCPEDSAINHTVFVDYTIYNRSASTLTDCYFGQWVDFDMGNSNDDYVGCDVSRGTFFGYNGDNFDEDANGVNGYGYTPPFQGVTFLKGAKQTDDGNDNPLTTDVPTALAQNGIPYAGLGTGFGDGTIDNEYIGLSHFMYYNVGAVVNGNGDPRNGADYYDYMRGHWLDGVGQVVWGGDGNPIAMGGGTPSNYLFPGNSDPLFWSTNGIPVTPTTWTEVEAGNPDGDRRGMGSTGPFTLLAGESAQMEVAFVFGRDYNGTDNWSSFAVMQERVDS